MRPEQELSLGTQLRRLREAAGLTQEELALRAGLTPNAVSDLERGRTRRPYPNAVRSIADALGFSEAERTSLLAAVPRRGSPRPRYPPPPPVLTCRVLRPHWWVGSKSWRRQENSSMAPG